MASGISYSRFIGINLVFCALAGMALLGCGKKADATGTTLTPTSGTTTTTDTTDPAMPATDRGTPPTDLQNTMQTVSAALPVAAGDCAGYGYSEGYLTQAVIEAIVNQSFSEIPQGWNGYGSYYDPYGDDAIIYGPDYYGSGVPSCARSLLRYGGNLRPALHYYSDIGVVRSWVRSAVHSGFKRFGSRKR